MPQIRGRWVGGLTMPSDTDDLVVYTVGQTDGHSIPDHTTRRADIEWNRLGPQATLLMHPRVWVGPTWLDRVSKKPSVKADILIYSNCVTVSGYSLSVAIIISNKMDFNSCANWDSFPKSSHIYWSHKWQEEKTQMFYIWLCSFYCRVTYFQGFCGYLCNLENFCTNIRIRDKSILLFFSPIFLSSNSFFYLLCSIFCSSPNNLLQSCCTM